MFYKQGRGDAGAGGGGGHEVSVPMSPPRRSLSSLL